MSNRRSKAVACSQCRKSKTRCEVLSTTSAGCHRCQVLNTTCSYEAMANTAASSPESDSASAVAAMTAASSSSSSLSSLPPPAPSSIAHEPVPLNGDSYWKHAPRILPLPASAPKQNHLWSFIPHRLDWSAPIVAVQSYMQHFGSTDAPSPMSADQSLQDVLLPAEIEHLITIFNASYTPWLNFVPVRGSFIDLVCCSIAIRHITPSPRLVKLTEDKVARMVFSPQLFETIEAVQSLIILSLWQGDGKVLIGMAASIASNLQLTEASRHANKLRAEGQKSSELVAAMDQARLWIMLANTETLLCLGSHKKPSSFRSEMDTHLFTFCTPDNPEEGRDVRIRILAEVFNAVSQGLTVKTVPHTEIQQAHSGLDDSLDELDGLLRVVLPLSVISDHDRFTYHMLQCLILVCRLIVLQHGFFILRSAFGDRDLSKYPLWFLECKVHGKSIAIDWGKDQIRSSEALLTTFLHCDSSTLLGTCPDVLFASLTFAATMVVGLRLYTQDRMGVNLRGPGEKLLQRTSEVLKRIALDENHSALKAARAMDNMLEIWEAKKNADSLSATGATPQPGGDDFPRYCYNDEDFWAQLLGMAGQQPPSVPV